MSAVDTYLRLKWYERDPKDKLTAEDREARIALQKRAVAQFDKIITIIEEAREVIVPGLSVQADEWLKKHPRQKNEHNHAYHNDDCFI